VIVGLIMTPFKLGTRAASRVGCRLLVLSVGVLLLTSPPLLAQAIESTGTRALGMGGAFVAVANDSSAVWWNPGGLADGPFLDASVSWATSQVDRGVPAGRNGVTGFFLGTPPFGFSFSRLRMEQLPTGPAQPGRQDEHGGIPLRSLSATQIGVTVVHSFFDGVHAGATVKYLQGSVGIGFGNPASSGSDLLDDAGDLDRGETQHEFDLDLGVLAVRGPWRAGAVMRNVFEPSFGAVEGSLPEIRLPRQLRLGGAYDWGAEDGPPLTVALDVDVLSYDSPWGDRRVVALGAEHWIRKKRVAVRGGVRFNTAGSEDKAGTAGASVAIRPGLFADGHVVWGGQDDERGWGLAARVSF
jgi:hypothetical protein